MWNNLDGHSFRHRARLVAHVVDVSAADVSEALACSEGFERAVVLVDRDRSLYYCNQAGTRMGVPPSLTPWLPGILGNIEVRVASHSRIEKPIRQVASTHQIEQARREVAGRHGG